jgi:DNA-binding NtrC family response regulator
VSSASPRSRTPLATILVVDDERGPREALRLILQRDYTVLVAESGEQALEIVKNESVDAATLDLKMPGLAGQNTLSLMREIDPALEVIIVTGYGSFESAVKALRLRAFDYISKPFDSRRILDVVQRAVERRRRGSDPSGKSEELIAPLNAVLEVTEWLEQRAAGRLSKPDRAALECIRVSVRSVREQVSPKSSNTDAVDRFTPRKEHG